MNWSDVGSWLKQNAGSGAALVGSLLTGNVPGAVAAGVALVGSATGTTNPEQALQTLQNDPQTVVKLRELAIQNDSSIRQHIEDLTAMELKDKQAEHEETQKTIRNGDNSQDVVVRRTRPLQSWLSLIAAIVYVFYFKEPDIYILGLLLTLPWAYAGLRQIGKGIDAFNAPRK